MSHPLFSHPVVAGAGAMGVTLARLFAQQGYEVTLWNRRESSLVRAQEEITQALTALTSQGRLEEPADAVLARLTFTTDYTVYETADFVVENIAEDLAVKHAFFQTLSALVPPEAILTTNTSGLRVTDIAQAVKDPARFCGMHWWNPPDLIPLVEVTKGEATGQDTAQRVHDLALSLGKKPVIVDKDILGILGNRLQYAVLREALHILSLGAATPQAIDAAMKYGPGFRYPVLGPLEAVDLGGLHIFQAVSDYLFPDLGTETASPLLAQLAQAGCKGVTTGSGIYQYAPGQGEEKLRWRNDLFQKELDLLKDV